MEMAADPKNPVGPGNFTRDGHRVAIAEDGKILVRKDDWLSKYSWALYGSYDRLEEFVRPNPKMYFPAEVKGIQEIEDVNRIDTGEYLVHVPTYFDWMEKRGKPSIGVPRKRPRPKPDQGIDPTRLERFLRYVKQWLCPVNDWSVVGTGGLDLSAWMFCAHYCSIGVQRTQDPDPTWYHAFGAGVGIGPEDVIGSLSWSPSELPSAGFIGKFPWAGRTLSVDEICGNYWFIDLSGGCFEGASAAIMFFGANAPPHSLMRTAVGYLRGEGSDALTFPSIFNGAILMAGLNLTTPAVGVSFKMGWMHRKECVTG